MFNLPLSKTLDVGVFNEENSAIHFHSYDGRRVSLSLTRDEALALIELLSENKEKLVKYLKSPDPSAK